jgi:predicted DNA-binding transcriptional regulator YafY
MRLKQQERLLFIIGALKKGTYPSAEALARDISGFASRQGSDSGVSTKTIYRDLEHLRNEFEAPIYYDERRYGYFLQDPKWVYPARELVGEKLFAAVLSESLSRPVLPVSLQRSLGEAMDVQIAAGDPEEIDPDLFNAVVFATGATPGLSPEVFDTVIAAWRQQRRLRLTYTRPGAAPVTRDVDVHAVFLSEGAWYARVYCHLRGDLRSLALHRVTDPETLAAEFDRDPQVATTLRTRNVFDYETVDDVIIVCSREKAPLISERNWFEGQEECALPDGRVELRFPQVPRPQIVRWVLSYGGHLVLVQPESLIQEVRWAAESLLAAHASESDREGVA